MASLTGQQINNSYQGLLKTTDNAIIGATEKNLTDGAGNASTLSIGTTSASFTGSLDLTGATVTGLPVDPNTTYDLASAQDGSNVDITLTGSDASVDTIQLTAGTNITLTEAAGSITIDAAGGGGGAGLVAGSVANSMRSSDALNTTPATSTGSGSIALGDGADATSSSGKAIAIGTNTLASGFDSSISIGANSRATGSFGALGLGVNAQATGNESTSLGYNSQCSGVGAAALGTYSRATAQYGIGVGYLSQARSVQSITMGLFANVSNSAFTGAISIGGSSTASATGAVALGTNVTASKANTTTVNELEIQTVGGGITMYSPNGTEYKLTVSDLGDLVVTAA